MDMKWPRLNLYRKVLLILLTVGLVPAALGVALTARELWQVTLDVAGGNIQSEAQSIANLINDEISAFIQQSERALAEPSGIERLFEDPAADAATTTLPTLLSYVWLDDRTSHPAFLLPVSGSIRAFVLAPGSATAVPVDSPRYKYIEARREVFRPGYKAFSIHTDPILDRPVALAWFPVSRVGDRQFVGWLGFEVPVAGILSEQARRMLQDVRGICLMTLAGHLFGTIMMDAPDAMRIQERLMMIAPDTNERFEGRFEADFPDGREQLVGYSPIKLTQGLAPTGRADALYIVVQRDLGPFKTAHWEQLWRDILAGLILIALLSAVGYLFARRLTRPILELQEGVHRVAAGDLASRVQVGTGDELEALARSFNEMAGRLEQAAGEAQQQMATVRRQADELALLHDVSRAINRRLDLDQTLAAFARETAALIAYDRFSVALIEEDGEHFAVQFVFPESGASEFAPGTRHVLADLADAEALATGRPIVRRDLAASPACAVDEFLAGIAMRALMIVPLVSEGKTIGSVNLASRDVNAFRPEDQERMANLAEPVAVAIQHSHLYMRVRRFAEELEGEVRRRTAQLRVAYDKLIQTEKLAATGQLAAGIAHEINNPLGIIKNYLRLSLDQLRRVLHENRREALEQHLSVIDEEISRIARIVRNLLDLYHSPELTTGPIDVHEHIERVLELFTANWKKRGVEIDRHLAAFLPLLSVSPDRLRQILINLLRNAEDAIGGGGRITIRTRLEAPAGELENDQVVVEVEDNGCGIPRESLGRVFDPFFTTKKSGQGTGLGLSVTYGIIRSYGGTIDLDSEPGRGTRVSVRLPAVPQPAPEAVASPEPAAQ